MIQSLTPPPFIPISDTGIDKVTTIINRQLETVAEIAYVLGRIKPQTIGGKLEPWIHRDGTNEYYKAYPNDTLSPVSFSCVYFHDDERWPNQWTCTRSVSVIVWVDLTELEISLEQLKEKVRRSLVNLYCLAGSEFIIRDQTTGGSNGVYPGFDVSELDVRYLSAPYGGFRIECRASYEDICY